MNARWLAAAPALAALLCACLMVYLIFQIDETRRQLQSNGIVEFKFTQQTDHNFDTLAQALTDYRYADENQDQGTLRLHYIERFDVLYSLFKLVGHRYASELEHFESAQRYFTAANHFVDQYEPLMHPDKALNGSTLDQMINEARKMSKNVYQLGSDLFEQKSITRERISLRMNELYEALWVCCIIFFITLSFALLLFTGLTRRAEQLGVAAKQSQTQLNTALDELTSGDIARKTQNRFVAAASHDLRQPLHALGLYLQAMKSHVVDEQGRSILENSYRSAEALNQLLNSMLDLSRLDAGVIEVNPEHLCLETVFSQLQQSFAPNAQQRQLQLKVSANDTFVLSDPLLLNRVLTNLLSNALYYTEKGSVIMAATAAGDKVTISVKDTGCGIAKKEQELIFDEYYQLHNPERDRTKGLGIGLSIVKRLTPLLKADLTLESAPGKGSNFRLTLPRGDKFLALDKPLENVRQDGKKLHNLSIMVIDDEKDVREGMEAVLDQYVARVVAVESAQSALEFIVDNEWVPGMVIADYRLRNEQTGDSAILQIREELNEDIPAMIITGDTSAARLREAADTGIELLHKPLGADELLAAITRLIGDENK